MKRRGSASIAANPVLIGAATTLVIVVAVFLAYNANSGLPFVPTYSLTADVPSAAQLVKGNDVRLGGVRVGVVDEITPRRLPNGRVVARLGLKLEEAVKPLPVDSTLLIRPRSALGLKYVELTRGTSARGYPDGGRIRLGQARPQPVEFDEVLSTFDEPTRVAIRSNTLEFGDGFADRGADLNVAIGNLGPLLTTLQPVARNLADPRTKLARLVRALGATAAEVAPVAETQASLFRNLDTTFSGLAQVTGPIQDTISGGPPALEAAIVNLPQQYPFLRNTEAFFGELRPGARSLVTAAPALADAFTVGTPVLRRSVAFNEQLRPTFTALQRLAEDPLAVLGIRGLTNTSKILAPTVAHLKPAQTVCNYITLFFRNTASLLSQGDALGTGQRFIIVAPPQGKNNEGLPSSTPANGPGLNYLHANAYPNADAPGQTPECEAGNETFSAQRQVIGNVPGNQGLSTQKTTVGK